MCGLMGPIYISPKEQQWVEGPCPIAVVTHLDKTPIKVLTRATGWEMKGRSSGYNRLITPQP